MRPLTGWFSRGPGAEATGTDLNPRNAAAEPYCLVGVCWACAPLVSSRRFCSSFAATPAPSASLSASIVPPEDLSAGCKSAFFHCHHPHPSPPSTNLWTRSSPPAPYLLFLHYLTTPQPISCLYIWQNSHVWDN